MQKLIIVCTALAMTTNTLASAAVSTSPTEFLPQTPLIVTSYLTNTNGTDLKFIELYNNSKELLDVRDWSIVDVQNNRTLQLSSQFDGLLEPEHHVVAARTGEVSQSTYQIDGWDHVVTTPEFISTLRITRTGYRPNDVTPAGKNNNVWMTRTYNTSSYSATTFESHYRTLFDDGLYAPPAQASIRIEEIYPYASDCAPDDTSILCRDYVKLYNPTDNDSELDGLVLRTDSSSSSRTSSNTITLAGILHAHSYMAISQTDTGSPLSLTNSGGYIWIEDLWGLEHYDETMTHYEPAGSSLRGFAYARDEAGEWDWTSTPMPDRVNVMTIPETVVAPCPAGKYRNPDTNRCRSIASEVAALIPCSDGYQRNPATNRCRKVQSTNVPSAAYPVQPYGTATPISAMWWGLAGVAVGALGYGVWEWRQEIGGAARGLWSRLTRRG